MKRSWLIPRKVLTIHKKHKRERIYGAVSQSDFSDLQSTVRSQGITIANLDTYKQNKLTAGNNITISNENVISANVPGGSTDVACYECYVTRVLDGTDTQLWLPKSLDPSDFSLTHIYTNCSQETCPVRLDYASSTDARLKVFLRSGTNSLSCSSIVYVSENANFGNELACWGYDSSRCQVVAGMNRIWHVSHNDYLDQNGIRTTTQTLKQGTLTISFTFTFNV